MGTRSRADARGESTLTPTMRWSIAAVAAVVVLGLSATGWLLSTTRDAAPAPLPSATGEPMPGPVAGATPVAGSEVQPPEGAAEAAHLPQPLPATPLVHAPLPEDASARNALVAGFPVAVAGPAPAADVIDSSLAQDGIVLQAALTARTDADADTVLSHYRELWSGLGLARQTTEGSSEAFSDTYSSVSVSVAPSTGTGTVYTVYAVLRTE